MSVFDHDLEVIINSLFLVGLQLDVEGLLFIWLQFECILLNKDLVLLVGLEGSVVDQRQVTGVQVLYVLGVFEGYHIVKGQLSVD